LDQIFWWVTSGPRHFGDAKNGGFLGLLEVDVSPARITTTAQSAASRLAIAAPMPRDPPVTSAVLP